MFQEAERPHAEGRHEAFRRFRQSAVHRSAPAKLSYSKRTLRQTREGRPDFRLSQTAKGPAQLNRTGPPDGLAVCLPGCNRLKLPGCSSDFAYCKYSGIGTYFKAKMAQKNRGFRRCRKLVFFRKQRFSGCNVCRRPSPALRPLGPIKLAAMEK